MGLLHTTTCRRCLRRSLVASAVAARQRAAVPTLPAEERSPWHSHDYEVASGELTAPGVAEVAEHALMTDLVSTYGKTWHTWQIDRDLAFPMGIPQLMMGFTKDGQVDAGKVAGRDARFGVSMAERRRARGDIAVPAVDPAANAWRGGRVKQLVLRETTVRNLRG